MSNCSSCQAPVRWAQTEHGKRMPVDVRPVPNGNIRLIDGPTPTAVYLKAGEEYTGLRYVSHFATCRFARSHRKSR